MTTLILIRHGESEWNKKNLFTGWEDPDLSEQGKLEAKEAGRILLSKHIMPDLCHSSYLTRAIHTAEIILSTMGCAYLHFEKYWRLNERHYGALTGLNKKEITEQYGVEQVNLWRRSYDVPPPPIADSKNPAYLDTRYKFVPSEIKPVSEALSDVKKRLMPYFEDVLYPELMREQNVMVVAHGNSLRALIMHLEGISKSEIVNLEIPTGIPIIYEFSTEIKFPAKGKFLMDESELKSRQAAVANQTKL